MARERVGLNTGRRRKADVKAAPEKPPAPAVRPENIPAALRDRPVWTCWRWERGENGEWTKPPYHPGTLRRADVTKPENLTGFGPAFEAYRSGRADGVGVALGAAGLLGYDRDDCRDPDTGEVDPDALEDVRALGTYAEVSPSGTGIKALCVARKPGKNCRSGDHELYDRVRYFTITGNVLPGFPGEPQPCQEAIDRLYRRLWPVDDKPPPPRDLPPISSTDEELLAVAFAAKNGPKVRALWDGDTSGYGGDDSRADCALLRMLAFYFGTGDRLEAVFGRSALGRRKKWTDRADYRRRTLTKATEGITEFYKPPRPRAAAPAKPEPSANGKHHPAGDGNGAEEPGAPRTAWEVIADYFRARYAPGFRRGDALFSTTEHRDVRRSEACGDMPPDIIADLKTAENAPRDKRGAVDEERLPGLFRKWAGTAWLAVVNGLPDEDGAAPGAVADAREEFVRLVRQAMLSEFTLGWKARDERGRVEDRVECRSAIDWCRVFAKPGSWRRVRSKNIWTKEAVNDKHVFVVRVALRPEAIGQLRGDRRLTELTPARFAGRATRYGIARRGGQQDRPGGQWCLILEDWFVADLMGGEPDDEAETGQEGRSCTHPPECNSA